ncbi:DUF29 domain-containing protein [Caballeronia sp. SBC2]|uniref:DUF29 domain-containing protein n=1 Tax=Caballeronia sp. SBC2 TaxID=2705547 RepID=UPI0013E200BA|nr:DUF29 domain-containing protein [Caballeronia sp. SBC2]QIE22130.1 hypothetical protein SBC2_01390 [Caballeronia sp. SBC2]
MTDYDTDLALWAAEQAALLRANRFDELDRHNLAEELETLARGLRRELVDRLTRLLQHLLQWELLEGHRLPAWYAAIQEERDVIPRLLEDAPSLADDWPTVYEQAWQVALDAACAATGLSPGLMPLSAYRSETALDVTFWPGKPDP